MLYGLSSTTWMIQQKLGCFLWLYIEKISKCHKFKEIHHLEITQTVTGFPGMVNQIKKV